MACRGCPSPSQDLTDLFHHDTKAHGNEVVEGVKLSFRGAVHRFREDVVVVHGIRNRSFKPVTTSSP